MDPNVHLNVTVDDDTYNRLTAIATAKGLRGPAAAAAKIIINLIP